MIALAVAIFLCLFAVTVTCTHFGLRFMQARGKKQLAVMLQTPADAAVVTTRLLKDVPDPRGGSRLEIFFNSLHAVRAAADMIQQAGIVWSTGKLFRMMAMMALPGMVVGIACPVLINAALTCMALGAVGGSLPYLYVRRLRSKRMDKLEAQLPDAMDFLSRSMRAGHAFTISVGMAGDDLPDPLGMELRTLFNEQNLGATLNSAFGNLTHRVPLLDMRFFASAVLLQRQTGGNLSEILERLSQVIRERFRLRGHVKAVSAHGRMTAGILSALPIVTAVALLLVAPGYLQGMFSDPDGKKLITGAVISQFVGNFVIRKIIKIRV